MDGKQQSSLHRLTFILILLAGLQVQAADKFDQIISKHKIPRDHLGLLIVDSQGKKVFGLNEDQLFVPASISKLATTLGIIKNQDLSAHYKTQILTTGNPDKGVLKGNLYFKGGGDPSFVSENLWYLVNEFKRTGIKEIKGDIVVDDTLFDHVRYDESREDLRVSRAYDAPVGALSFNWNSVNVFARPGAHGEKAKIFVDPENEYFEIENKTTTSGGSGKEITVDKVSAGPDHEKLIIRGKIGENADEQVVYLNAKFPDTWAGENLKSFLSQRGIKVNGNVHAGTTPSSANVVAEFSSKPFGQTLADMNKFSNNFVAEMLTKNLATGSKPATMAGGLDKIREALKKIGLTDSQFKVINPSGLTRENRFSSSGMVKILKALKEDYRWRYDFYASLPIAGIDGTLKKRMKGSDIIGRVRAKTGHLSGVTALAGFGSPDDGRELIFSFMFNGSSDEAKVRDMFDELIKEAVISK